ncbi:hypothetical protein CEUSTIGMA_g785.t1 [Chlamydomonas eustigma]|uniref:Glycosyltransferase family 92 protein n=1 Tax=Chlamydomonas eustigma TaxID=1157962 RepID=A0A250WRA8_9CHLO|nr:hypothetical protein CEUSTIGMA_g785.t1 [Chlamydomonas eustigma]|eukprot:GAX73331.1 hypothetical protein CEUSTIGMA_g785.t1 [Chlamydomonas eustigma]
MLTIRLFMWRVHCFLGFVTVATNLWGHLAFMRTAMAFSNIVHDSEAGVWHCRMSFQTDEFIALHDIAPSEKFDMHIFLRYTYKNGSASAAIKGNLVADVPQPPTLNRKRSLAPKEVDLDPKLTLFSKDSYNSREWPLQSIMKFSLNPISIAVPVSSFHLTIQLQKQPGGHTHDYFITALGGGPNKTCHLNPIAVSEMDNLHTTSSLNTAVSATLSATAPPLMGLQSQSRHHQETQPTEAVVVICPLWNVDWRVSVLVDRHIQYYAALGFTRYIIYTRPSDVEVLSALPHISKWLMHGMLILIRWSAVGEHDGLPYWDQRVVYNHAVLAHLGRLTYLAMVDIDEYLIPLQPGLANIFQMVSACAPAANSSSPAVNLQLPRFHVVANDWEDRFRAELPLWVPKEDGREGEDIQELHPITKYTLVNQKYSPAIKSMVVPRYIGLFHIHIASTLKPYTSTAVNSSCMVLAHIRNLMAPRESLDLIKKRYYKDAAWTSAIMHVSKLHAVWRASSWLTVDPPHQQESESSLLSTAVAKGQDSADEKQTKMQLSRAQLRFRVKQKRAAAAVAKRKGIQESEILVRQNITDGSEDAAAYQQTVWPIEE